MNMTPEEIERKKKEANYIYAEKILDEIELDRWTLQNVRSHPYVQIHDNITDESILRYIREKNKPTGYGELNNLKECYELIREVIGEYMDIEEEDKTLIAIWTIGTYFHDQFESYPYLFFNAMRGSGKTRIQKLITSIAKDGILMASPTEAVLFRTKGTLAIDEFESLASKEKQAIRELLNASYKKGTKIFRLKRKKTLAGEEYVAEEFEPYRPIVMANIWGIEEVLADRCITIILEKSDNPRYTKILENFGSNSKIQRIREFLNKKEGVGSAKCIGGGILYNLWNIYITYISYTSTIEIPTPNNYTSFNNNNNNTLTTLPTLKPSPQINSPQINSPQIPSAELEDFFNRVNETGITGRYLELYFPLFVIAREIDDYTLWELCDIAKKRVENRKVDEITESKDVLLYKMISQQEKERYYKISDLSHSFKIMAGEGEAEWITPYWMGRALKRLNLIIHKRRVGEGIEVVLNIEKARKKLELFK